MWCREGKRWGKYCDSAILNHSFMSSSSIFYGQGRFSWTHFCWVGNTFAKHVLDFSMQGQRRLTRINSSCWQHHKNKKRDVGPRITLTAPNCTLPYQERKLPQSLPPPYLLPFLISLHFRLAVQAGWVPVGSGGGDYTVRGGVYWTASLGTKMTQKWISFTSYRQEGLVVNS